MKRRIRRDKNIPSQRLSDKILLFLFSNPYLVYLIYSKKLRHTPAEKIMRYETFVRKIVHDRLFVVKSLINPEINLFCRAGHEMSNLSLDNYENEVKSRFCPKSNDIVIDIGAHIGEYALPAAKNSGKVVAVEPNPDTFTILKKNIELNKISNVIPINQAIFDSVGFQELKIFGDKSGMSSMILN